MKLWNPAIRLFPSTPFGWALLGVLVVIVVMRKNASAVTPSNDPSGGVRG